MNTLKTGIHLLREKMTVSRTAFPQYDPEEFLRFIGRFDRGKLQSYLADLEARFHSSPFLLREYAATIVRQMQQAIAESRPASFLRLGDGEGDILAGRDKEFSGLARISEARTSARHFGKVLRPHELDAIRQDMQGAICSADFIGLPTASRIENMFRKIGENSASGDYDFRGVTGTINAVRYAYDLLMPLQGPRIITNCYFHRDLLPFYPELLTGQHRIGLVSCYPELPSKLQNSFGIDRVDYYPIPNQASNLGTRPPASHYPDAFGRVMEMLAVSRPGQIILVGAGILAKAYCHRVKQLGGIGLDIGSMADVWMGKTARRYQTEEYLARWKL